MDGFDALTNFVNQEADYNFVAGLEMLKKGGAEVLAATSPFSQVMSESLNQDIKAFADYVNQSKVGQLANQGAQAIQESGADYGIPVAPVGALWKTTNSFLKKLSPEHYNNLSKIDIETLKSLTESYPAIKNARLGYGTSDAFGDPKNWSTLKEYVQGKSPGKILLTNPENYISHPLEKRLSSPAISYAHEGSHAFTGGPQDIAAWGKFAEPNYMMYDNPTSLAAEGFAEGVSHTAMNKYNKEVFAPYWQEYKEYPSDLKDIYIKAGYLGADVGSDLRKGLVPNQEKTIEKLLSILKGVY